MPPWKLSATPPAMRGIVSVRTDFPLPQRPCFEQPISLTIDSGQRPITEELGLLARIEQIIDSTCQIVPVLNPQPSSSTSAMSMVRSWK
jgi:hypothetical protein